MKCRRARKLFFDFLDGVIVDSDRVSLEEHLVECQPCASEAASMTRSIDLLHRLPAESPAENFNWKVRLQISREKNAMYRRMGSERAWMRSWNIRFATAAVSALAVALAAGYFIIKPAVMPSLQAGAQFTASSASDQSDIVKNDRPTGTLTNRDQGLPRPVALGGPRVVSDGPTGPIEESPPGFVLDPDTLVFMSLESKRMKIRLNGLQQQVETLQKNLRDCK